MKVYTRRLFLYVFASVILFIASWVFLYIGKPWSGVLCAILTIIFMVKSLVIHAELNSHYPVCSTYHHASPQPINTAPKDGTIILGWWQDDEDPRPCEVFYSVDHNCWMLESDNRQIQFVVPPTHWTPIVQF